MNGVTTRMLRDGSLVVWAFTVLGIVAGLAWAIFAPYAHVTRFENAVGQGQLELSEVWYADAWFVVFAAAAGLMGGLFFGFRRRMDPVAVVVGVLLGSLVGVIVMAAVGQFAGPSNPAADLRDAAIGATAGAPLDWPPLGIMLAWPIAALPGLLLGLFTAPD